jgi:hypothetical protein
MEGKPMNPADDMPAKIEAPESTSAPSDSAVFGDKLDEHTSIADSEGTNDQARPVEELRNLLLRISHHLDYETSERSTIYYRLLAIDAQGKRIESQTKRRALRALFRYAIVICLAVAATLAWQSYGEAAKQIVATRAPDLGWSPQAKETIASWVAQLGLAKATEGTELSAVRQPVAETPQPIAVTQSAPDTIEAKAPAVASVGPEQMQQLMQSLSALQQSVGQLATTQDQMGRQITSLQASEIEILKRIPAPPPPAAPVRKPIPGTPQRAPAR